MFSRSIYFLVLCSALVCLTAESIAQSRAELDTEFAKLTSTLTRAIETSVFESGKLRSVRIRLSGGEERLIKFEYPTKDGKSYTMIDQGVRIHVLLDDDRRISSMVFPDGKTAFFDWILAANGYWLPKSIKVDGRDLCGSSIVEAEDCREICQNAAAATAIAIGQCIASGPTSGACYAATATAAYLTYRCYRCTNPQIEWPPES